jgi:fusion protein PurCD
MATKDGVGLIEYNARFGDPEAMNALTLLETDFVDVCEAILEGTLNTVPLSFSEKATVCKYVVPQGYPDASVKDVKVTVGEIPDHVRLYYGSVDQRDDGLFLCGSRAIAVVGIGDTLEEAEKVAEKAACAITGPVFHRRDIGTAALIQKRVDMMRSLRGA